MAAAAQDVWRPHDDRVAQRLPMLGGFAGDRELAQGTADVVVPLPHLRRLVIVGGHDHPVAHRLGGQPPHRRRNLARPPGHLIEQSAKRVRREAGALGIRPQATGLGGLFQNHRNMVVEGQQVDAAVTQPAGDLLDSIEVIDLVAQVNQGVANQPPPHPVKTLQEIMGRRPPAQTGLPRPRQAVKGRRDAIGDHLTVGFQQRHIQRKGHAGTRHDLSLKGIPVQVDDAGQEHQAIGLPHLGPVNSRGCLGSDRGDAVFDDQHIDLCKPFIQEHVGPPHKQHSAIPQEPYLSQKAAASSARKSGSAAVRRS